ncbi:heme exporter protein A [Panacagrimonas perspica]|uniref:Heme exporter protein A n=1 Tax=Panacagrimonas perspica TaxID=381431 RepID=A0A4R7PCX4_9GAMM|nr:heme exporter protein A [Panacagrimonas perspica]
MLRGCPIAQPRALIPFLSASDLSIGRGDRTLLSGLNLSISPGDVLHLRGRNGAGKSSLIEVLVGLRPARGGTLKRPAADQFHWIGHRNALNSDLGVRENLEGWCALNGVAASGIAAALERTGLARLRHRQVRTLSAGQKRRAALTRLLLAQRPLWLLDEPLSGLDGEGLALLGQLMNEHVAGDGGIVVTSHQSLPGRLPRVTIIDLG